MFHLSLSKFFLQRYPQKVGCRPTFELKERGIMTKNMRLFYSFNARKFEDKMFQKHQNFSTVAR